MWCAVLDDQLIGPSILEVRLTGEAYLRFLQEELPQLLEDVLLNKRGRMYFQHDGSPHFSREVRNFLNYHFLWAMDRTWPSRQLASQVSRLKSTGLLCMGMDEKNCLRCEVGTQDALIGRILDAADRIRNSQRNLQRATCAVHN